MRPGGRWLVVLGLVAGFTGVGVSSALAGPGAEGSSELNPWTLEGELMAEGGAGVVVPRSVLPCPDIHAEIDNYNEPRPPVPGMPPEDVINLTWPLSSNEVDLLYAWTDEDWTWRQISDCTTMHHDGYKPATVALVNLIDNPGPIIKITAEGETTCDYGEVLISDAFYYFSPYGDDWISGFGKNWEEVFHLAPGFEVHGEVTLHCLEIVGEEYDVVNVGDAVPTVQVNHDPLAEGLTGIDTWLWYDFDRPGATSELNLSGSIDAYGRLWTLDAFAWIDWIGWDVDCEANCSYRGMMTGYDTSGIDHTLDFDDTTHTPAPIYYGGTNAEGESAATHIYEVKGDFNLSTVTVWRGYYVFNGLTTLYDPVVVADSVAYNVIEIRSVLGGEDG